MKAVRVILAIPAFFVLPLALVVLADLSLWDFQIPRLAERAPAEILADDDARSELTQSFADDIREDPALSEWHAGADLFALRVTRSEEFEDEFISFWQDLADQYRDGGDGALGADFSAAFEQADLDPELSAVMTAQMEADFREVDEQGGIQSSRGDITRIRLAAGATALLSIVLLAFSKRPRLIPASIGLVGGCLVGLQALLLRLIGSGDDDVIDQILFDLVIPGWWYLTLGMGVVSVICVAMFLLWSPSKADDNDVETPPAPEPVKPMFDYVYRGDAA